MEEDRILWFESAPATFFSAMNTGSSGSGQGHSHNMSANFSGSANSVLQPFLTLIYIIKT
jgi:hypothetical protein